MNVKEEIIQDLPKNIRKRAKVTMSYQMYMQGINSNLKKIYGRYADWTKCIDLYFKSSQYKMNCHYVQELKDIPLLKEDDIEKMLKEEANYSSKVRELLLKEELIKRNQFSNEKGFEKTLYDVAEILGINPELSEKGLYEWLINKEYISTLEYSNIKRKYRECESFSVK